MKEIDAELIRMSMIQGFSWDFFGEFFLEK